MTKLLQWLACAAVFLSIWVGFVTETVPIELSPAVKELLWPLPVYLLMVFACYSLAVVGYGVATFNDCEEASTELKQQITQARKDLQSKGFKFS